MRIFLNVLHIIFCVSLIVVVLLQSSKQTGLSSAMTGGAETFFGKNKGKTIDSILGKYTTIVAIGFLITSIWLQLLVK